MASPHGQSSGIWPTVLAGVIVAMLAGGSAPWWFDRLPFGQESDETTTAPDQSTTQNSGSATEPSSPTTSSTTTTTTAPTTTTTTTTTPTQPASPTGCTIAMSSSLVRLMEEPDNFGLEVGRVPPGSYAVQEIRIVDFVGDQRWYRINTSIGQGWVLDNSIQISSKTGTCT